MSANTLTPTGSVLSPWTVRGVLRLDVLATGGNGLAYLAFTGPFGELLGLGRAVVVGLGALLTGYALAVAALAARRRTPRPAVLAVVGVNSTWVVLSSVVLAVHPAPTAAGAVWIPLQAAAVALFVVLQLAALRRSDPR
ncbi:hypothetical protein AB0O91_17450 [Kitasatospora sp. NPDC089797]|uniref:hypothetical protein n=1 Tax=Kitasatospora sp. NPDC089797 TaxID=3155298 RepID=UPI0034456801